MILEYHRPKKLHEALELLNRDNPPTRPLAGGTLLNQPTREAMAVVDLQSLGLDHLERTGNVLRLEAMVRLQALLETLDISDGLKDTIRHEAPVNLRQAATVAGSVAAGDGRSPFLAALLALDVVLEIQHATAPITQIGIGDWLPLRGTRQGELITAILLPLKVKVAYQYVARSPADLPIIAVVAAQWPSSRTRLVVFGWGSVPMLAMDGPESSGADSAARKAASQASDAWASSEYRQATAPILTNRAVQIIESKVYGGTGE